MWVLEDLQAHGRLEVERQGRTERCKAAKEQAVQGADR